MSRNISIQLGFMLIAMALSWSVCAHNKVVVIPLSGNDAPSSKIIFITNETMNASIAWTSNILGNIVIIQSGPERADAICQSAANADGSKVKSKVFKAWLSGDLAVGYAAGRTFERSSVPYVRVDGMQIADNYKDLISTNTLLSVPISFTETGESVLGSVWTGILSDARDSAANCNNWTSDESTDFGNSGLSIFTDDRWTSSNSSGCDELKHLYCIEQ